MTEFIFWLLIRMQTVDWGKNCYFCEWFSFFIIYSVAAPLVGILAREMIDFAEGKMY